MRGGAAGLVALALAFALAGGATSGAAAECTWRRHSKVVVKKVRRHGRVRRVKRTRHWWACDPVAAGTDPPPPGATSPPPADGQPPPDEQPRGAAHLGVQAEEWSYTLSRPEVPAGELVVELNNMGEDPHDLNLRLEGDEGAPLQIPVTPSRQQETKRFTLPAGTYRLWCDLDEHDERGMHATLVVAP